MTLEEALAAIPEEWTAWELYTRQRRRRFVFVLKKLRGNDEEEFVLGGGATALEAINDAIRKAGGR